MDQLKDAIKAKKAITFSDIEADQLTLWCVSISITDDNDEIHILLDNVTNNKKLSSPRTRVSKLFPESPDDETYIIVQRPPRCM